MTRRTKTGSSVPADDKKFTVGHVSPAPGLPGDGRHGTFKLKPGDKVEVIGDTVRQAKAVASRWRRLIRAGAMQVDHALMHEMQVIIKALLGGE